MPSAHIRDIVPEEAPKPQETKDNQNSHVRIEDGVRRVTGSADIELTPEGKEESKEFAEEKATKPFDLVLSSPEKRAIQTAKEFGTPIELGGLQAWARGSLESKPVDQVKAQIKFLMLNPDKRPPGNSPVSGEPGQSLNEFARPFLATMQTIKAMTGSDQRVLVVSHGGNAQCLDAWLRAGAKDDFSFDNKAMAQKPYWTILGELFMVGDKGLVKVPNNGKPGLYICEHGATPYNAGPPGGSV